MALRPRHRHRRPSAIALHQHVPNWLAGTQKPTTGRGTSRRQLLGRAAGGGAALGVALAGPAAAQPDARGDGRGIVGAWRSTNIATNPPLEPFHGLLSFTSDGLVSETRRLYVAETPFGPLMESPGHGRWARIDRSSFAVYFCFLIQGAPNNPALNGRHVGTDNIRWTAHIDGDSLTGPWQSDVKDPDDNVVFSAHGTISASRIALERLS